MTKINKFTPKQSINILTPLLREYMIKIANILNNFLFTKKEKEFIKKYIIANKIEAEGKNGVVIIDIPDQFTDCIEQLYLTKYFCEKYNYAPLIYYPNIVNCNKSYAINKIKAVIQQFSKGQRLARLMGAKNFISAKCMNKKIKNNAKEKKLIAFSKIKTRENLLALKYNNINIGEAIYDTYLRRHSAATLNINDSYLHDIAVDAFCLHELLNIEFKKYNIKTLILGHCVYVNWKIPSDYAISNNINVLVSYNSPKLPFHHVNLNRGLQTIDHSNYKCDFDKFSDQDKILFKKLGIELMNKRVSGKIDEGLSYMSKSAYSSNEDLNQENLYVNDTIIMMLHSFFDSPHIYNGMIFTDFHDWCEYTIQEIQELRKFKKIDLILKPHPNRLNGEDEIINTFKIKYPWINIIDSNITNNILINKKPKVVLTVYGTVAAEFSFKGIPVITCGDNPTSSFEFCYQAKTKYEYSQLLIKYDELSAKSESENQIGIYAYMHYINGRKINAEDYPIIRYNRHQKLESTERIKNPSYENFANTINISGLN